MKRIAGKLTSGRSVDQLTYRASFQLAAFAIGFVLAGSTSQAWHPEKWFDPSDPRPDFLPHTITNAWVPYRKIYNRPTYVGGHIAAVVEPTSQEAMAWKIHKENGDYRNHCPGSIPLYLYPKPWEVLPIGSREKQ